MDINHRARRPTPLASTARRRHVVRALARHRPLACLGTHPRNARARAHRAHRAGRSPVARASPDDGNAAALDLLERLQRAYETDANGSFVDAVIEAREHLTLLFFDVAEERVRSLEASGDAASASALMRRARR